MLIKEEQKRWEWQLSRGLWGGDGARFLSQDPTSYPSHSPNSVRFETYHVHRAKEKKNKNTIKTWAGGLGEG